VPENDIPDLLACWAKRKDANFVAKRSGRLNELTKKIAPLKSERLKHHEIIHRLKFEEVIAADPEKARTAREKAEAELSELQTSIAPLQAEINQLGRQFWVDKKQVVANKYDLSASRYRDVERDEAFLESPSVTLDRLAELNVTANSMLSNIRNSLP
jgi:type I restriction enzyme M protein